MKYTDAFYVATQFCLLQRDTEHCGLKISAEIRYLKQVNGFIKCKCVRFFIVLSILGVFSAFIEKNAHSSIDNGVKDQSKTARSLESISFRHSSSPFVVRRLEGQQIGHVTRSSLAKPLKPARKQKKIVEEIEEESSVNSYTLAESYAAKTLTGRGVFYDIGLFVGLSFLLLHLYLCYKLYSIDRLLSATTFKTPTGDL